jgi:hypothetical protein
MLKYELDHVALEILQWHTLVDTVQAKNFFTNNNILFLSA